MNNKNLVLNTIGKDAHWNINKALTHFIGDINSSLYLSDLISWYKYFESEGKLEKDGSFYTTAKRIEESTLIKAKKQYLILKLLEKKGLVTTKRKGIPAKLYKKINFDMIGKILLNKIGEKHRPSSVKNTELYTENNNKERTNTKVLDTTSKEVEKTIVFKNSFAKECILKWNSIPHTQNIRVTSRTKTIERLETYFKQLRNGSFFKDKSIDTEWFNRNSINTTKNCYKKEYILQVVHSVSLYLKQGYPPSDKKYIPKDLLSLIYNPRTQTSWFLKAMFNKPKLISYQINKYPELTKHFSDCFPEIENLRIIRGVSSIVEFHKLIPKETLEVPKLRRMFGTPEKLCSKYTDYLLTQHWLDEVKPNIINTNNKVWAGFIVDCEEDCGGYKLK